MDLKKFSKINLKFNVCNLGHFENKNFNFCDIVDGHPNLMTNFDDKTSLVTVHMT